ncbi:MAG TPA: META domain-containing protein [Chitinophagaceae bacterium]|nr:META domain-containing protein [Chitinophagaceae bacterium]
MTPALFTRGQSLQPGFDQQEFRELLRITARFGDTAYARMLGEPEQFRFVYRSPVMGLDNRWDLWADPSGQTAVVSLRGTTGNLNSWLANFYAAMVPARGTLQLDEDRRFEYDLAVNPAAAVHVGWLLSTGYLAADILPRIDSCYQAGMRQLIVTGHSQGGAIAYLLTAMLYRMQETGRLPAGIRIKTYCSAAPKPGNLFFAHEYESRTQAGWAFNVVNSADWVPETPVSIQSLRDFNKTNPFSNVRPALRRQRLPARLALGYAFRQLDKPTRKAQRKYEKYLGRTAARLVRKHLPDYRPPAYAATNNYVRTGNIIVLLADSAYYREFPDSPDKVFVHHSHRAYARLLEKVDGKTVRDTAGGAAWGGSWRLKGMPGAAGPLDSLFPGQLPGLTLDPAGGTFTGNGGCNTIGGTLTQEAGRLRFPPPIRSTRMLCPGQGEQEFLRLLRRVDGYQLREQELLLLEGDEVLLQLVRVR